MRWRAVAQRRDVAALDGAALAQVVAHHEGGLHRLDRAGCCAQAAATRHPQLPQQLAQAQQRLAAARQRTQFVAKIAAQPGACPQRTRRLLDLRDDRPPHLDREIQPRQFADAMPQIVAVVEDVDAADKRDLAIDHTQFLVQAAQLPGLQPGPPAVHRTEDRQRDAGSGVTGHARLQQRHRRLRAEAVDDDAHPDTAPVAPPRARRSAQLPASSS